MFSPQDKYRSVVPNDRHLPVWCRASAARGACDKSPLELDDIRVCGFVAVRKQRPLIQIKGRFGLFARIPQPVENCFWNLR
jgi:hypothetical protein